MLDKKSIIENELIKEIISIRIDTLWKMIEQKTENRLPEIETDLIEKETRKRYHFLNI